MNLYESALRDLTKCVNEWRSWGRSYSGPSYIVASYKGRTYMCDAEFETVMNYAVKRWASTVEWCQKAGLSNNVERIFWRNLYPDKETKILNIMKELGIAKEQWKEFITNVSQEGAIKEYYLKFEEAAKARIDKECEEEDRKKAEAEAARQKKEDEDTAAYEEWLLSNDWVADIDSLSYAQLEEKYDELKQIDTNDNQFFKEIRVNLVKAMDEIMRRVPAADFGTINGWSQQTQDRFSALAKKLDDAGYTRDTYGKEIGRCWNLTKIIWKDKNGNPVYIATYDVDSSD